MSIEDVVKEIKRELVILTITDNFIFSPKLTNIVKYDNEIIVKRKKILGFPIGRRYEVDNGSTDSYVYRAMKYVIDNHNVILTGSCALRVFGLLYRHVGNDLDFIASQDIINDMSGLYKEYTHNGYNDSPDLNYVKTFVIKSIKVDVFLDNGDSYRLVDNIKVHEPFELINVKLGMGREKDIDDSQEFIKLLREKSV